MTIAQLQSASKIYFIGDTKVTALHKTDLEVRTGEVLLIIGPSGSGKTTLLALLGCVVYPSEGEVWVAGRETSRLSDVELARLRLRHVGFVFQHFNLMAPLNVEDNVAFPLHLSGTYDRRTVQRMTAEALEKVSLTPKSKSMPSQLSGGEQQRVAIARALVTDPAMLLCDEPTAALDASTFESILEELRMLARQGRAVVMVTHDPRLKAFADRTVQVVEGKVSET